MLCGGVGRCMLQYTIYIPIKKENVLKLPVEIPDGQVGKLSNPVPPPSTTCVVFEQAVLHVTVDVQLTAKTSGCTEQPPRVNVRM